MSGDRPVTDLRTQEMELRVDGRPRRIVSLDYRPADREDREGPPHRVVLVIDRDSIEPGEARQLEQSAGTFIRRLPKNTAVAVATLPIGGRITFEPDRAATLQSLKAALAAEPPRLPRPTIPPGSVPEPPVPQAAPSALSTLVQRASAYVHTFEQTLSSVVAEERYVQIVKLWKGDPPKPDDEAELEWKPGTGEQRDRSAWQVLRRRQLLSDLLLVQPPGKIWIGFRDVAEVNGTPVRDRSSRVKQLFLAGTLDAQQQLQHIADESARYNLGASRNINMPTFPLELLYPANVPRFEWKETRESEPTSDGGRCTTLSFRETADPTLVRTDSGRNVPITGTVCVEPATGRVWRMRLNFRERLEHVEGAFEVVFRPSPRLSVLIPDRIWEWSLSHDPEWGARPCYLEGRARYTNVRRFTVTTEEELK